MTEVSREEKVTRYALDPEDIRKEGVLHWRLLMPDKSGETSVFRIYHLSEDEIWNLGFREVASVREKPLVGRGDLMAAKVYDKNLRVSADIDPNSRHANIVGWPEEKAAKRAIALELAEEAEVRIKSG